VIIYHRGGDHTAFRAAETLLENGGCNDTVLQKNAKSE
jgi:hypothetical protein